MQTKNHLFDFLKAGVSPFHTVSHAVSLLEKAGFTALDFGESWTLEPDGAYYCRPHASQLFAFRTGQTMDLHTGLRLTAAHTDWPCLRIKPEAAFGKLGYLQANVEIYGGPILSTFFDRPLSIAGKVVSKGTHPMKPQVHYADFKKPLLIIPNLAIHMSRGVNEEGMKLDKQTHLMPLLGLVSAQLNEKQYLLEYIAAQLGIPAADILDYELFAYNLDVPSYVGLQEEFISAPRLDNITSVCASIHGLIEAAPKDTLIMSALFDNEEIGSRTKQGADSYMLTFVLEKIWAAAGKNHIDWIQDISRSYILSMDVGHGCHPNYTNTNDLTNLPTLGKGFCIKSDSNQKYTWDSEIIGTIKHLCQLNDIPWQTCVKRTGSAGGGTIGPILSAKLPVKTADIGVPLLSMHSSRELMGTADQDALEKLVVSFYSI